MEVPHAVVTVPDFSWMIFLCGCIGAAAPEIVRLQKLKGRFTLRADWHRLGISILFFGLGGFLAWLSAATCWGAFYVGVSTPVIVSSAVRNGGGRNASTPNRGRRRTPPIEEENGIGMWSGEPSGAVSIESALGAQKRLSLKDYLTAL